MEKPFEIYDIVKELEESKENVNKFLKEISEKTISEKEFEFNSGFETLQKILKEIGRGLNRAANNVAGKDDLIFYFWPGYTTIEGNIRVLIKGKIDKFDEVGQKYYTGIGFKKNVSLDKGIEFEEFFDCPSTLYYDAVLNSYKDFVPPTTHNWKRQQPDFQIRLKDDDSNLKILLIEKGKKSEVKSKEKTILHLTFNENEVENSVEEIANFLEFQSNNICIKPEDKICNFKKWPFNSDKSDIIQNENLEAAQKIIYPVWFAATFCDSLYNYDQNQKYGDENWLKKIKDQLCEFGYTELCQRIKDFQIAEADQLTVKDENYHNVHFTHWYSLFFDNYDYKKELGSAMFLTNVELPEEFLYYVSPWLKFIYSQIRALESATLIELKTKKAEWETIVDEMSHSMAFPFGEIYSHLAEIKTDLEEQNYTSIEFHAERSQAVITQLRNINLYLFYLVKAEQSKGKLSEDLLQFFKLEKNDLCLILNNCFKNIENSLELLRIEDQHRENIQKLVENIFLDINKFKNIKIVANNIGIEIVLLDLLKNALRCTLPNNPIIKIEFIPDFNESYSAISIMNNYYMEEEVRNFILYDIETKNWSKSTKVGIRTVNRIIRNDLFIKSSNRCQLDIPKNSTDKSIGRTIVSLLIPKEAVIYENK